MVWYPLTCSVSRTSFKFLGLSSTMRISSFAMTHRNRERERRAHTLLALDPDPPAVGLRRREEQRVPFHDARRREKSAVRNPWRGRKGQRAAPLSAGHGRTAVLP